MSTITLKKPSATDKDENRLVLVSNLENRWLEPQGLFLSQEVLQENSRVLGPFGVAVYVAWQFLTYMGNEPTVHSIAAFLGCQKVTVKRHLLHLTELGLIEEVL